MIFSDYAYQINDKLKKSKRLILITEESLFCLRNNRYLTLLLRIPLKYIVKMTLIRKSSALMCISFTNSSDNTGFSSDFLIETLKRTEMIFFIL